ncbi:uncharacterized protein MONOS_14160 [Monocercomonoides exilis]|uniref:uncharacterized protein n=1 Tax=Monocercomonoides exilis TaxID=2049356 RepID=UPI00355A61C9|nr:hypothetical protein MONOS_14160 [Monocercomonoides exilis]|eukprot:MONOS_14160.1-p1 / transcript=MONOS_14160.1 / gene=MONOS_14160 / organism=Monocercomonoides_exilis_PA203 / gene_product=unspecified product / transcript_product=unspecified product / location=Mono_scaffold00948:15486-16095(-) / protein_length=154 / sequence_SO=supercontig / SO=protein_coding / is_pseudo=false
MSPPSQTSADSAQAPPQSAAQLLLPASSALPPTAPSPQSPPPHTLKPLIPSFRHPASPPHDSTVAITISAATHQTDLISTGAHSHQPLQISSYSPTSSIQTLQAMEEAPPAEPKASRKVQQHIPVVPAAPAAIAAAAATAECAAHTLQPPLAQ